MKEFSDKFLTSGRGARPGQSGGKLLHRGEPTGGRREEHTRHTGQTFSCYILYIILYILLYIIYITDSQPETLWRLRLQGNQQHWGRLPCHQAETSR